MRFNQARENNRGRWCDWVFPKMEENFLMKCCDCGLVHEIQFQTGLKSHWKKEPIFTQLPKEIKVSFRVRRLKK
jgi:hypothetical protein